MLNDLLNALDSGKTVSLREIAAKQHRSIEAVKAEIAYLEHQGYIKRTVLPSCQGKKCYGCKGCASPLPLPLMWEKT
ncbi:MAG: FeoC-like transcriptional regulator [Treponema sp.]|jgi:predicted transcriptional regulator|nr:FeoC-like transcriptional regulator [Treponema sp.]